MTQAAQKTNNNVNKNNTRVSGLVPYKNRLSLIALALGATLGAGSILASTSTSAVEETTTATASVTVAEVCTFTSTTDSAHTATISPGTYVGLGTAGGVGGIGQTALKVTCNDSEGFSIYAVGYTGDTIGTTTLVGTKDDSSAGTGVKRTIVTGTATSGNTSNWAMQVNAVSGTYAPTIENSFDASSYHAVPDKYTKIATRTSSTDLGTGAIGSSVTTTYGAYIGSNEIADTYTGKVKYTLVHPASETPAQPQTTETGKICYYANNSKAVGTMGCQSIASSVDLLASNFSLDGYGFAGWSDQYDYATNQNAHFYGPQETITINTADYTGDNNGLSLYAVWVKSKGDLQNWTGCSSLTKADEATNIFSQSITALSDQRDNNTYAVAKLADGNCWMIENLRLESTNSDNSTGALAQGYGKYSGTGTDYGNFSGLADAENADFTATGGATDATTANSLYYAGTQSGTATINISQTNYAGYRMPRYNNYNNQSTSAGRPQNPTTNGATNSTTKAGIYSYGNYYTWHAAIADLTYNGTNNQSNTGTSLCPTGWHLPTGGSVTTSVNVTETPSTWREFYNLGYGIMGSVANDSNAGTYAYYNNTTTNSAGKTAIQAFRSFPNNFLYSGYFDSSSADYGGIFGNYWSSTARSNYDSYRLTLHSTYVSPGTYNDNKYSGYSIRCLAGS